MNDCQTEVFYIVYDTSCANAFERGLHYRFKKLEDARDCYNRHNCQNSWGFAGIRKMTIDPTLPNGIEVANLTESELNLFRQTV